MDYIAADTSHKNQHKYTFYVHLILAFCILLFSEGNTIQSYIGSQVACPLQLT